jgi:hypothetical protein
MRRPKIVAVLATLAATMLMSGCSAAKSGGSPILTGAFVGTHAYPGEVGFGTYKPSAMGDRGTYLACHIHWHTWGGQVALGTAAGYAVNPVTYKRVPTEVVVILADLGTWHHNPAYTKYNVVPVPTQHHALKACDTSRP